MALEFSPHLRAIVTTKRNKFRTPFYDRIPGGEKFEMRAGPKTVLEMSVVVEMSCDHSPVD